jgi:hypothetical protein
MDTINGINDNTSEVSVDRKNCKFHMNSTCYKLKNNDTDHLKQFVHPCKFFLQNKCTKTDDDHLKIYEHIGSLEGYENVKRICRYNRTLNGCNKKDDSEHLSKFFHPERKDEQLVCKFHRRNGGCNKIDDADHTSKYTHSDNTYSNINYRNTYKKYNNRQ